MQEKLAFPALVEGLCRLDNAAVEQLLDEFGSSIMPRIARWLKRCKLQALYEPGGILDQVVEDLPTALAEGRFKPTAPGELTAFLTCLAHCRVIDLARHHRRELTHRLLDSCDQELVRCCERKPEPWQVLDQNDLLDRVRSELSAGDWDLVYARAEGQTWPHLGRAAGTSADGVRMKHRRLMTGLHDEFALA